MTYRYADPNHTAIIREDGTSIPVAPGNRDYDALVASGASVFAYTMTANQQKEAIKAETNRRILAAYPDWKQRNMIALGVSLTRIKAEGGSWTAGQQAEAVALDAAWAWIQAMRSHSDDLEAAVDAGTLAADWKTTGWPE